VATILIIFLYSNQVSTQTSFRISIKTRHGKTLFCRVVLSCRT